MKRKHTLNNHQSLKTELKTIRLQLKQQEIELKTATKRYIYTLPRKIFNRKKNGLVVNPIGKILSRLVRQTVLKKEGFITKLFAGIFAKRFGRMIEKKIL